MKTSELTAQRAIKKLKLDALRYCYESASVVIALKDNKTLVEICSAPEMIEVWEEPENPLFTNPVSCGAIEIN